MKAFGEIVVTIFPGPSSMAASLRAVLGIMETLSIDGMLRSIHVDCCKAREVEIALIASDNWCNNLENGATRLLELLSNDKRCDVARVKFCDFPVSNQLMSEAYKERRRSEQ